MLLEPERTGGMRGDEPRKFREEGKRVVGIRLGAWADSRSPRGLSAGEQPDQTPLGYSGKTGRVGRKQAAEDSEEAAAASWAQQMSSEPGPGQDGQGSEEDVWWRHLGTGSPGQGDGWVWGMDRKGVGECLRAGLW